MTMTTSRLFEFRLPDIGEGVVEGELVKWLVQPGDEVAADQPLFEVMTDKATVELSSPRRAKILSIHGQEGQIIKVGDVVVRLELAPGETAPVLHGHGLDSHSVGDAAAHHAVLEELPEPEPVRSTRALATPATRKLARELGVDLARITGTGPRGRVTKDDVRAQLGTEAPAARPAPVALPAAEQEERIPLRGLRKKIAEKMVLSKFTAPHFTYMDELDAGALVALRQGAKAAAAEQGVKLTYLPFIMKAVVAALKQFPLLNASLDDATGELVVKHYYHLGVAVATDRGLIVPVIRNVDQKSILTLARELAEVSERTRQNRNHPEELRGGTFTLSSIGSVGGLFATPIINHPEVGILAVMRIQERPVVRDGQIVVGQMMNLALSFDHRVVDGAVGADFTNTVIRYLEQPGRLMLELS